MRPISSVLSCADQEEAEAAAAAFRRRRRIGHTTTATGPMRNSGLNQPGLQRGSHPYRRAMEKDMSRVVQQYNSPDFDQNPWSREAVSALKNVTKSMTSSIGRVLGGLWLSSTRNEKTEDSASDSKQKSADYGDQGSAMSVEDDIQCDSQQQPHTEENSSTVDEQLVTNVDNPSTARDQLDQPLSYEPPKINWKGKAAPKAFDLNGPVVAKKPSIYFDPTDSLSIITAYKEALRLESEAQKAEEARKDAETKRRAEAIERRRTCHERKPSAQQEFKQLVGKPIEKKRKLSVSEAVEQQGQNTKREKVDVIQRPLETQNEADELETSQQQLGHKIASTMSTTSTRSITDSKTTFAPTAPPMCIPQIEYTKKPILDWSDIPADRIDRQGIFTVDFDYSDDDEDMAPEPPKPPIATLREALMGEDIVIPQRLVKRPTEEDHPDVVKRREEIAVEKAAAEKKKEEEEKNKSAVESAIPSVRTALTVEPPQKPNVIPLLGKPSAVSFTQSDNEMSTPSTTLNGPTAHEKEAHAFVPFGKPEGEIKKPDEKPVSSFSFPTNEPAKVDGKDQESTAPLFGTLNGTNSSGSLFGVAAKKDEPNASLFERKTEEPKAPLFFGAASTDGSKTLFGGSGASSKSHEVEKPKEPEASKSSTFSFGGTTIAPSTGTFTFGGTSSSPDQGKKEIKPAEAPLNGALFQFKSPQSEEQTGSSPFAFGQKNDAAAPTTTSTALFGLPATSSVPTTTPFIFGTTAASASATSTAAKESEKKPFVFGGSSCSTTESKPFAFGTTAAAKEGENKPFTLGAVPNKEENKAFTFGAPTTSSEQANKSFTFGGAMTPKEGENKPSAFGETTIAKEDEKKAFTFGAAPKNSEDKPFIFGAPAAPKESENKPFTFGGAKEGENKPFGAVPKTGENQPFAFGRPAPASSTSAPFGAPVGTVSGAFQFGSSTTPGTPGAIPGMVPSTGFSFGSQPVQPAVGSQPFGFGQQQPVPAPQTNTGFTFGAPTSAVAPAAVFGFRGGQNVASTSFGSSASPAPGAGASATNMFASGTTAQTTPAGRKMAPMRRRIRR